LRMCDDALFFWEKGTGFLEVGTLC
jgi:hypothetical protein